MNNLKYKIKYLRIHTIHEKRRKKNFFLSLLIYSSKITWFDVYINEKKNILCFTLLTLIKLSILSQT